MAVIGESMDQIDRRLVPDGPGSDRAVKAGKIVPDCIGLFRGARTAALLIVVHGGDGIRHLDRVHIAGEAVIVARRIHEVGVEIIPLGDRALARDREGHIARRLFLFRQGREIQEEIHADLAGEDDGLGLEYRTGGRQGLSLQCRLVRGRCRRIEIAVLILEGFGQYYRSAVAAGGNACRGTDGFIVQRERAAAPAVSAADACRLITADRVHRAAADRDGTGAVSVGAADARAQEAAFRVYGPAGDHDDRVFLVVSSAANARSAGAAFRIHRAAVDRDGARPGVIAADARAAGAALRGDEAAVDRDGTRGVGTADARAGRAVADGYRTILSGGLIRQIATNYFHNIYLYGFRDNTILNLCLLSVCAVAVFLMYRNNLKVRGYVKVCFFLFTCYVLYALFISLYVSTSRGIYAIVIDGIFAFLALFFLYLLSFTIGKSSGDKNIQFSIYYTLLSIVLIIAPLFIVNPIGPRCFISSYIYFILLLCLLIKSCKSGIIKSGIINTMQRSMRTLCLVASCAIFFVYFGMFLKIHNTDIDRIDYIQTQVAQGRNEVEILHFDYESYLWTATPEQGSIWEYRYKLFYDIPESVSLTPVWKYS